MSSEDTGKKDFITDKRISRNPPIDEFCYIKQDKKLSINELKNKLKRNDVRRLARSGGVKRLSGSNYDGIYKTDEKLGKTLLAIYTIRKGTRVWYSGYIHEYDEENPNVPTVRFCSKDTHGIELRKETYISPNEWKEFYNDNKKLPPKAKTNHVRWCWITKP